MYSVLWELGYNIVDGVRRLYVLIFIFSYFLSVPTSNIRISPPSFDAVFWLDRNRSNGSNKSVHVYLYSVLMVARVHRPDFHITAIDSCRL